MKFLTMGWWGGVPDFEPPGDPLDDYRKHLATIRDRLPADLLMLQTTFSLHDSRLREMIFDATTATLDITLESYDGEGGSTLHYSGVTTLRSYANPEHGLGGPHGYGDWGYDEADIAEDGRFEHRILFSSGIEFQIVFDDLKVSLKDGGEPPE